MAALLPILTFHDLAVPNSPVSIRPGVFRRGLTRLFERGYRTLSLSEAVELIRRGEQAPSGHFVITFDDGYRSVYEEAFPTLIECGMSATVFLAVGRGAGTASEDSLPPLCNRPMLSWSQIREMRQAGIELGAHTLTHPDLTRLPGHEVESEIHDSKVVIEQALGTPVRSFAYPFGRYDDRSRQIVQRHFQCGCSDRLGLITPSSDPYALERVDGYYLRTDRLFAVMSTRWLSCYVRARSIPRRVRRAFQLRPRRRD